MPIGARRITGRSFSRLADRKLIGSSSRLARHRRRAHRGGPRFQERHQWPARGRGARRRGLSCRPCARSRRFCRRRCFFRYFGLPHLAHHFERMRGGRFLAFNVLRQARQAHPAGVARRRQPRVARRLVSRCPDPVPRRRRLFDEQLLFHRELLVSAAGQRHRLFRRRFVHEAFAASLVAQHRRAVLSRLVGPAAGAFQAEAKPAPARHRMHLRRFAGGLRHPDACRSDRRFLFALDPRMGARPWRDARLSRGLPDRASALPGADWRQYRRRTRDRADARRFVPDERGAAVSGLARRNPDRRLRSRHRASARSARRIGARQQSRRLFWRHLVSTLSLALAPLRLRASVARDHSDASGDARADGGRRRTRDPHPPSDRGAGRDAVSTSPLRDRAWSRPPARCDRHRRPDHL